MREERRLARERALEEQTQKEIKKEEKVEEEPKETSSNSNLKKIILIIIILLVLSFFYVKEIGNKHLMVNEYKVESKEIPDSFDGLKIVHFSDIHYGTTVNEKELKNIVSKINELKPDIVFFTGDFFDKDVSLNDDDLKKASEILKDINSTLYRYAIYGDMDNDKYTKVMTDSNFTILNNEVKLLYYNGNTPIVIAGFNTKPDYSILNNPVEETDISSLYKIVLVHEPDEYDKLKSYSPNLTLSGHSLGGLVQIPGIRPLFLQEGSKKYYKASNKDDNKYFFISNGLGTTKLPVRINNRPSINLYRIYKVS